VPEREHIRGVTDCPTERGVIDVAYFACPDCDHPLTAKDRVDMVHASRCVDENTESMTFSFRWNAFDNLFWTVGEIGLDEWRAHNAPQHKREDMERVQHQFKWAKPIPAAKEVNLTSIEDYADRAQRIERMHCPWQPLAITAGADIGKHRIYWVVVAHGPGDAHHVIDYGRAECPSAEYGEDTGIRNGLAETRDLIEHGGTWAETRIPVDVACLDYGYASPLVWDFATKNKGYFACKGCGATGGYKDPRTYRNPAKTGGQVLLVGDKFDLRKTDGNRKIVWHDVDYGKLIVRNGLETPTGQPGCITLFEERDAHEHDRFKNHMVAEQLLPDKNGVLKWQRLSRNNHWLDAMALAMLGYRMVPFTRPSKNASRNVTTGMQVKTKEVKIKSL